MRLLLDECLDPRLKRTIGGDVETVKSMGWLGRKNGDLLRAASEAFDAIVTADQNMLFQQPALSLPIRFVLIRALSTTFKNLEPLGPRILPKLQSSGDSKVCLVKEAVLADLELSIDWSVEPKNIEAELIQGGESYRAEVFDDGRSWMVWHTAMGGRNFVRGATRDGHLTFLSPEFQIGRHFVGKQLMLHEGFRQIGVGTITKVLEPLLSNTVDQRLGRSWTG